MPLDNNIDPAPPRSALSGLSTTLVQWLQKNLEWAKQHISDVNAAITDIQNGGFLTAPVSLDKLSQIAANTILGNNAAGAAIPAALTAAQIVALLDVEFPKFRAGLTNTQNVGNSVETQVLLDHIDYDTHNGWDPVNYRYVFQKAGYYQLDAAITTTRYPAGLLIIFRTASGILTSLNWENPNLGGFVITAADKWHFNVGDHVQLDFYQNSGANQNISGGGTQTYMAINRIF